MDTSTLTIPISMVGLNHKFAPVEVREKIAFNQDAIPFTLQELKSNAAAGIDEIVLLSTCNRTEIYLCTNNSNCGESGLRNFLAQKAGLPLEQLNPSLYTLRGAQAAHHLMQVATGLDSLVLGENEILGQVRSAVESAQEAGTTGPMLSALFRFAIQAGKRARSETDIGSGDISVASVVVELATKTFGPLDKRTALLIGAGKISSITARALTKAGLRCIMIANRTYEKAKKLARSLKGEAVHFDVLDEVLSKVDIVICSTGAPHIVLHAEPVEKAMRERRDRPLLVADLAVPRDADPEIASLSGVILANIDDLDIIVKTSHPVTASICQQVENILQQENEAYCQWIAARRCVPVIKALHSKAESICRTETERTLRRLGPLTPRQERLVQALGRSIASKLLHEPTIHLREASRDEELPTFLELVQDLYDIP